MSDVLLTREGSVKGNSQSRGFVFCKIAEFTEKEKALGKKRKRKGEEGKEEGKEKKEDRKNNNKGEKA